MSTFIKGQLCVPSDNLNNQGALIDIATATRTAQFTTVTNECGAILPGVGIALGDTNLPASGNGHVDLYDLSFSLTHNVALFSTPINHISPVTSDYSSTYYCIRNNGTTAATVKTLNAAGSVGGTTFTLTGTVTVAGIGVNAAGTILYYCDAAVGGAIKRWNLQTNSSLPDLVAGRTTNRYSPSAICLPSGARAGDFLVAVAPDSTITDAWQIERYTSTGVLAQVYALDSHSFPGDDEVQLAIDLNYSNTFWTRTFPNDDGDVTVFTMWSLNGTILQQLTLPVSNTDPNGVAPSCPFFAYSQDLSPAPPSGPFAPDNSDETLFVGTEATMPIRRERTISLPIMPGNARQTCSRIEIQFQPGTGIASDPTAVPQFFLRMSWDNGKTWSNERLMSAGREGAYITRAFVNLLGSGLFPVVQLATSDTFLPVITDAFYWADEGTH